MPIQEAKLSTNIRLKFRSRQPNAMIFLTSGRTDHCLLTLNDGRIKFQLKINEYETEVSFDIKMRKENVEKISMQLVKIIFLCKNLRSFGRRGNLHSTILFGMKSLSYVMRLILLCKSTNTLSDERYLTK